MKAVGTPAEIYDQSSYSVCDELWSSERVAQQFWIFQGGGLESLTRKFSTTSGCGGRGRRHGFLPESTPDSPGLGNSELAWQMIDVVHSLAMRFARDQHNMVAIYNSGCYSLFNIIRYHQSCRLKLLAAESRTPVRRLAVEICHPAISFTQYGRLLYSYKGQPRTTATTCQELPKVVKMV